MFEMWGFARRRKELETSFAKTRTELETKKASADDYESLRSEEGHEFGMLAEEEDLYISRILLHKAKRHHLPLPDYGNELYWQQGRYYTSGKYLTDAGIKEVRKELRAFWKWRLEVIGIIGSVLIGLVGAVTGLLAVVLR